MTVRRAQPGYEYYTVGRLTREQMDRVAEAIDEEFSVAIDYWLCHSR